MSAYIIRFRSRRKPKLPITGHLDGMSSLILDAFNQEDQLGGIII